MLDGIKRITPSVVKATQEVIGIFGLYTMPPPMREYPKDPTPHTCKSVYEAECDIWWKERNSRESLVKDIEKSMLSNVISFRPFIITSLGVIDMEVTNEGLQFSEDEIEKLRDLFVLSAIVPHLHKNIVQIELDDGFYGSPEYPIFWDYNK